ncbi:MAG: T9SS type A sorting domain-containing protein, partial [Bacteroidota bacterium]
YPNPFNPTTNFSFAVKKAEQTTLKVYNILGAEVASLFNDVAQPDQMYTVSFNGSNLSSGTYFYILRSSSRNEVKKMLLMK